MGNGGEAATKLEWNKEKLLDRVQSMSLYKSGVVRNAKRLLQSQLGANIDNNYVSIGHPLHVGNKEQLNFISHLHETIMNGELNPTKKKTDKDKNP